jgi:DNA-binding GntR family transcriptional regulator
MMHKLTARSQPSYARIRDTIREEIVSSGETAVFRLPTERQLQERFGVSRQTVRRALQDLVHQGLIRRGSGSGTYSTGMHLNARYVRAFGSVDDLKGLAEDTSFEIMQPLRLVYSPEAGEKLLLASLQVGFLQGRRVRENVPVGLWSIYLPPDISTALQNSAADFAASNDTVIARLERDLGYRILKAEQTISAGLANHQVAEILGVRIGEPLLHIERVYFDRSLRPIEYAISEYPAGSYAYRIDLYRTDNDPSYH